MTAAGAVGAVLAVALAGGCAHAGPTSGGVPATVVRAGAQCGGAVEGPSARWLGSEAALREALAPEGALGAAPAWAPVDFARQAVVLVGMGRKPTTGYGLTLLRPQADVKDGVATVHVRFEEPPPGAVLAQALTAPCLLVALPREGLREVRVVDAGGAVRATAPAAR